MIKNILKVAASALLFLSSVGANAAQLCDGGRLNNSRPLTILFVNGIFNDDVRSCLSSTNLRGATQLDSAKYNFDYIHNPDSWADTIELNEQQEISGAAVLETFRLYGKYDKKSYYIELGRAYKSKISAGNNRAIVNFTKALVEKLNALIAAGQRIVVVPHSQGNYYIEAAYAVLTYEAFMNPDLESKLDRIRVVGVANVAHTTPNDRYITIIEDRAIAGLEAQTILIGNSAAKPMERNNAICNSLFDIGCLNRVTVADPPSRHDFNLIYLSRFLKDPLLDLSLQDIVSIKVKQSIAELESKIPPNDVTYTLESAFTSNSTLSAPWSFGWQVSPGAAPIPYAGFQPAGSRIDYPTLAIWNKVSGNAGSPPIEVYPWVVKNTGASPVIYSLLAASFPGQSVIVTPGSSGERAVFRWTAPTAGTYEINASYELMQGGAVDVHVQRNGVDIFNADIARQGSQAIVPAQIVTLSAGDTVDFVVGNGGNTQNSDITRVSASVKSAVGIGTIREKALWGNNGWTDSDTLPVCGVNWYRPGDGGTGKTLLQINHAEVPVNASRIFLNFYTRTWDNGGDASAEIYQVTQAWDPATVLWQTIPTTISAPSATFQLPANTPDNWVKVEITSLVKAWQSGTSNNGMLIDSKIDPWSYCRSFYSSNVEGKKPHVSWE